MATRSCSDRDWKHLWRSKRIVSAHFPFPKKGGTVYCWTRYTLLPRFFVCSKCCKWVQYTASQRNFSRTIAWIQKPALQCFSFRTQSGEHSHICFHRFVNAFLEHRNENEIKVQQKLTHVFTMAPVVPWKKKDKLKKQTVWTYRTEYTLIFSRKRYMSIVIHHSSKMGARKISTPKSSFAF